MDLYVLDDEHNPVPEPSALKWGLWLETSGRRRVALDDLGGGHVVSTVFLGINHNFGGGPPVLFETLIGDPDGEQEIYRYCTWDEAEKGHVAHVARITSRLGPEATLKSFRRRRHD